MIISEIPLNEVPDGWALLYDPTISETLAMNDTGILIYHSIDGKRTIKEIIEYVSGEFETPPKNIGKDVREFINSLVHENIASWKEL